MKKIYLFLLLVSLNAYSQSCSDLIDYLKENYYGTTYTSYNSDAISNVTFYEISKNYETSYFAIVCFKPNKYSINCREYIYQVAYNTKMNYSYKYLNSAGEAFWEYIQPYSKVLNCGPNFD
ncbi:hypothetical protein [Flavobacterium sp. I3-2]|uniref:hypothetical protein n=1 Tax=Flavobacterium sp. I3-2 TaxID=2748319 RepID=UPI0015AA6BFD|nr:hypothetical protein [Flavobacterium sp. I3-2]